MDGGRELETEARDRLVAALRSREEEAKRLESDLAAARANNPEGAAAGSDTPVAGPTGANTPPADVPPQAS